MKFNPLRELPKESHYKAGDVLVIFGEVFARGYVNGIIEEAQRKNMKIIYGTVGRRDAENRLRSLTLEELAERGSPLINVPLEAGFDLESDSNGVTPVNQLEGVKLSDWENAKLDPASLEDAMNRARKSFRTRLTQYLTELETFIPRGANVTFVHTMAGGVPRAKVVMPALNKVFKGTGDRYYSSEKFWNTSIGRLCEKNFLEVTAETLYHLLDLSTPLREKIEKLGGQVRYAAYGYHGNEILLEGKPTWQSAAPYLQGWAKIRLEEIAAEAWQKGVKCTVFNVPEILTNSSSIFVGVEIPLYLLTVALRQQNSAVSRDILQRCQSLLKDGVTLNDVEKTVTDYYNTSTIREFFNFATWPEHNNPAQMELMKNTSQALVDFHRDNKQVLAAELSEVVFRSCGKIMLNETWAPRSPAVWVGHDAVAKALTPTSAF